MRKQICKQLSFVFILNLVLYDISLLISRYHLNRYLFLFYMVVIDVLLLCIIFPFISHFKPRVYRVSEEERNQLHLLYQTKLPDADLISEDELYDIINLRTNIPEHTCSKSDYIKYLKRKGLLIVNGQHIWLYGFTSDHYSHKRDS